MKNISITERLLRMSLSFAFVYPAMSALFNPFSWIGYFPIFILEMVGEYDMKLLHIVGLFEVVIALWIMIGRRIFIPASIAMVFLFLIIILNIHQMDVLFRDIPILVIAFILACKHYDKRTK